MTLLSPQELRQLDALGRQLRGGRWGNQLGAHPSRAVGGVQDFADRRRYTAGDDLRRIDWYAYARGGHPVVRRFHAERSARLELLLDCSASTGLGSPPKSTALRRLCAAVGYVWLVAGLRVQLVWPDPDRDGHLSFGNEHRGERAARHLFDEIARPAIGGKTHLSEWLARLGRVRTTTNSIAVFSDFQLDGVFPRALEALAHRRSVALVQVLAPEELSPRLRGEVKLRMVENDEELEMTIDRGHLEVYHHNLRQWFESLAQWARRNGQTYVRSSSDAAITPAVSRLVNGQVDAS